MKRPRRHAAGLSTNPYARRLRVEQLEDRRLLSAGDLLATLNDPSTLAQTHSYFGGSVAVDGPYTVVGASNADLSGCTATGVAYTIDTSTGALVATLNNPTAASSDSFGCSVAVSGSTVVVGSEGDDTGASNAGSAYVFDAGSGSLVWTLNNPSPRDGEYFGYSVAVSGSTIVVGAPSDNTGASNAGSVYVFDATSGNLLRTLNNPTPAKVDYFGGSVAIWGNTIVVGAYGDDTGATDAGSAYVFDATSGSLLWTLNNPSPAASDSFGDSVAISGNTIVVGAYGDDTGTTDAGSAYVFNTADGRLLWTLNNPTPTSNDRFGDSVAVSGSTIVVGAYQDDTDAADSGSVYTFDATRGSLLKIVNNPTPAAADYFGRSVAISGTTIIVGGRGDDTISTDAGSAYVIDAATGSVLRTLNNPTLSADDAFGFSVAAAGSTIVVGAPYDNTGAAVAGTAYVFDATSGNLLWTLHNPTPASNDNFGISVAVLGSVIVVGARGDDTGASNAGSAYVFDAASGNLLWTLNNPTPAVSDEFGYSVAISGNTIVVGAYRDDTGAADAGSAYVFDAVSGNLLWTLNNPNPASGQFFGGSVSVSDSTIVVGARLNTASAAYVFDAASGSLMRTLKTPPRARGGFGCTVSVSGNTIVVGTESDDTVTTNCGSAYVFDATNGNLLRTLNNPTPAVDDYFGSSVSVSGNTIVVGANSDDTGATNAGSAYVFDASSGDLLYSLNSPPPVAGDYFGCSVAIFGEKALIGASRANGSTTYRGAAYLFDLSPNQAPVAVADNYMLNEDAIVELPAPGVLGNDIDPNGDRLSVYVPTKPTHGSMILNSDGSFRYQPNRDYSGQDSFTYRARDRELFSLAVPVTITINPVNDPPVRAAGDIGPITVPEDSGVTPLGLAGLDYGPGGGAGETGQTLSYQVIQVPASSLGAVVLADGVTPVAPGPYSLEQIRGMQFVAAVNATGSGELVFQVQDNGGTANGGQDTLTESLTITITGVNDPPMATDIEAVALGYLPKQSATPVTNTLRMTDVDSPMLAGATVRITAGFQSKQDVLSFTNTTTITGSWNPTTGTLTLSGNDTPTNYQAALRAVMYRDTSSKPNTATRTISFALSDGEATSNVVTRDVGFYPPVLSGIETKAAVYTENKPAIVVSSKITLKDGNSPKMAGATVRISGNYQPDQDVLSLASTKRITATWDQPTGTLTLTGSDTVANYQKALRAVKYQNTSDDPSTAARTVSFEVSDGLLASNTVSRAIDIKAVNNVPVLSGMEGGSLAYLVGSSAMQITASITVADPDSLLTGATIAVSGYKKGQDLLVFADTATIRGTWDDGKGILTLKGIGTSAAYQAALRTIAFQNTAANPALNWRAITFTVTDGLATSKAVARSIVLVKDTAASTEPEDGSPIFVARKLGQSSAALQFGPSPARQTLFASVQNWSAGRSA